MLVRRRRKCIGVSSKVFLVAAIAGVNGSFDSVDKRGGLHFRINALSPESAELPEETAFLFSAVRVAKGEWLACSPLSGHGSGHPVVPSAAGVPASVSVAGLLGVRLAHIKAAGIPCSRPQHRIR
jgi:hypothetical protein